MTVAGRSSARLREVITLLVVATSGCGRVGYDSLSSERAATSSDGSAPSSGAGGAAGATGTVPIDGSPALDASSGAGSGGASNVGGDAGASFTGGTTGAGGATNAGGTTSAVDGGRAGVGGTGGAAVDAGSAGALGTGGALGGGGVTGNGGVAGNGGVTATGGAVGNGGAGSGGVCGDGVLDIGLGEQCDDGGKVAGDGCSGTCRFEPVGITCGNGAKTPPERCDDSNTKNGDGCNPTCNLYGQVDDLMSLAAAGIGSYATMTSDGQNLWIGDNHAIRRVRLAPACLLNPASCTVQTVAGQVGVVGLKDSAIGTSAILGEVGSMTTDGSTLFFADNNHVLRSMSLTAPYAVTTLAGSPGVCDAKDGVGGAASFYGSGGFSYYAGYVYLVDACMGVLRRFDPATNAVLTIAGQKTTPVNPSPPTCGPQPGYSCNPATPLDGTGAAARFSTPAFTVSDGAGKLYVVDTSNPAIRSYDIASRAVGTLAGTHAAGYTDGIGAAAAFDAPSGLAFDGTSLYVNEANAHTIRQIVIGTKSVSTLTGQRGCSGDFPGTGGTAVAPGSCAASPPNGWARLSIPWELLFDYQSQALFATDASAVRRIR